MTDSLLRLLHDLPQATPDHARADRNRARCHAVLARRSRRSGAWVDITELWTPIAAGFAGLYLMEVVHQVLAMYGLL
jgi:hypothetical protein